MNSTNLASFGMLIIFVGFLVVIVGAGGSTSTGGFILIGPIPIVFGSGPNSRALSAGGLAISAVMVAVYLVSLLIFGWNRRREAE